VDAFVALGCAGSTPLTLALVHTRLADHVRRDLAARGVAWTPAVERELAEHLEVSAQGIVDYHERRRRAG
jgi:hypothetical protein